MTLAMSWEHLWEFSTGMDRKEASPPLLALSPLCQSHSQMDSATHPVSGLALHCCSDGPGNRNAGTNKACSWAETSEGTALLIATSSHLPRPHHTHTHRSKTGKCCPRKAGPAAARAQVFQGRVKMQNVTAFLKSVLFYPYSPKSLHHVTAASCRELVHFVRLYLYFAMVWKG